MFSDAEALFTIGQFAKLHEINKKTLMWYDEIGLLKPAVIRENGYRCYSFGQSAVLETILMLRELGVSLAEIQAFLQNRSADRLQTLLADKGRELEDTIAHLQSIRAVIGKKQQELATLRGIDLAEIAIVHKPEPQYLVTVPLVPGQPLARQIEQVIAKTKEYHLRRLHDAAYGTLLPVEHLYRGAFDGYTDLFIALPFPVRHSGLHIQPAGRYLRAFCKGSWDRLPGRYRELLDYAQAHGLQFCGAAYEKGLNELVIEDMQDYITQIEIPLCADTL